jgi:hypothetical protein
VPEDLVLTADQAVTEAQRLLDDGLPFPAHDVLEAAWKGADPGERELWRALAQFAVGLTHLQRGNARGAVALLDRSADGIRRWVGVPPAGLDLVGLAAWADALAQRVDRDGTDAPAANDLRPRLRREEDRR